MPIGNAHTISVQRQGASLVLVGLQVQEFSHDVGFTTTTTVSKNNIADTVNDFYDVKVSYPSGSIPATSTTIANLVSTASAAITSAFGAGELA